MTGIGCRVQLGCKALALIIPISPFFIASITESLQANNIATETNHGRGRYARAWQTDGGNVLSMHHGGYHGWRSKLRWVMSGICNHEINGPTCDAYDSTTLGNCVCDYLHGIISWLTLVSLNSPLLHISAFAGIIEYTFTYYVQSRIPIISINEMEGCSIWIMCCTTGESVYFQDNRAIMLVYELTHRASWMIHH